MTTLLTLNAQSKCIIPNDVKVICAQLQDISNDTNISKVNLVVNGKEKADYEVYKYKKTYGTPLVLHTDDVLEISGNATANILVEII